MCVATTRGEGSGTCRGDSGGPLQCIRNGHWYLAGVCSFGIYCGSIKYPTIFSRTTEAVDWIKGVQDVMRRE